MIFLALIAVYALLMTALGVWAARSMRGPVDFFVAGRSLGAGWIAVTLLAANIGAGSTVGAAGLGYRIGAAAWWWVGSAGIGSLILAFTIGPRIHRVARERDLYTLGDYLEYRYDRRVRGTIAVLLWAGSLSILAGQLIAIAWILNVSAGLSKPIGCLIGASVATIYFTLGGLRATTRVNALQLAVKLFGFALAFIYLLDPLTRIIGQYSATGVAGGIADPAYFSFFGDGLTPWHYLILLAPSFVVSPGLLQKIFGARDERAVRTGVAINALVLLLYAAIPVALGMVARQAFPDLAQGELALPMLLTTALPLWLGGLLLGAIFAAEVSTADAVLFMLSTSLSRDLYQTFIDPRADDRRILRVARTAAVACGALAAALATLLPDVISALTIFYALLTSALLLPLAAGLYLPRVSARGALAAVAVSVAITFVAERVLREGPLPLLLGTSGGALALAITCWADRRKRWEKG